jgi:hypothetical protein
VTYSTTELWEMAKTALQEGRPDEIRHHRQHGIFVGFQARRDALFALDTLRARMERLEQERER